jgi:ATP adenylyltransferase
VSDDILLRAGSLRSALERTARSALACGALRPIETEQVRVDDGGVRFVVRMVSSLQRKEEDKRRRIASAPSSRKPPNPFLPPEPELQVAEVSETHIAVLNKFNVLDHHLLIVTRELEHQETLLTRGDFRALCACMREYGSLGFYNGGKVAGASQPHKHLQLVPLPFTPEGPPIPMEPLLRGAGIRCPDLPFAHAFGRLASPIAQAPMDAADEAHRLYLSLLADLGIGTETREGQVVQSAPYNLLIAHDWMLAVPRIQEFSRGMSVNALGFAGSLFVKDREQLKLVCTEGPMRLLAKVAGPVQD